MEQMKKTNDEIREWEIRAHDKSRNFDELINDERVTRNFNSILYYNKPFVDFLVKQYDLHDKKILDYGCGSGTFSHLFSFFSKNVSGCDISKTQLDYAKIKNKDGNFFEDDFFNSSLKKNYYDFIFCRGLGPLQKIDYNEKNQEKVNSIIEALSENGFAYFILMGNLSGNPGNRVTGFQNQFLKTIFDFFSGVGHVSMINVFGYQTVIITKKHDLALQFRNEISDLVCKLANNLGNFDDASYLKCKLWLYVNGDFSKIRRKELKHVDDYIENVYSKKLVKGLCKTSELKSILTNVPSPFYSVSGDHDEYFSYYFNQELSFHKMNAGQVLKKFGKKWLKK